MSLTPAEQAEWNQTLRPTIYGVGGVLLTLSNVSLVLRLFSVLKQRGRLFAEDWFMVAAVLGSDGIIGSLFGAATLGLGIHEFRVIATDPSPPLNLVKIFQIIWASAVLNGFCFVTIKLSILLFYRRLFFIHRWFRTLWWLNVLYAVCWFMGSTLFYIFQCTPVELYWTRLGAIIPNPQLPSNPSGTCIGSLASIGTPIMLSTLSDVAILLLPCPILFSLQVPLHKRLRLLALFTVGLLASASGFVRFGFIFIAQTGSDQTYTAVEFLLWGNVEQVLGILCANVPLIVSYLESRNKPRSSIALNSAYKNTSRYATAYSKKGSQTDGTQGLRDSHPRSAYDSLGNRNLSDDYPLRYSGSGDLETARFPDEENAVGRNGIVVRTDFELSSKVRDGQDDEKWSG